MRYVLPENFTFETTMWKYVSIIVSNFSNKHEWHAFTLYIYNTKCYYSEW